MNRTLAFQIALTHLVTKRRQSLVAMLGVMFGISMFIVMISFMTGVNNFMEDVAMDGSPHLRVYNPLQVKDEKIIQQTHPSSNWFVVYHQRPKNDLPKVKNALLLADEIEKLPGVEGVAPQVSTQAFFNNGPIKISGSIAGIDVQKQKTLFNLENKMEEGSLDDLLKTHNAIVLGKGLAKKANASVGDRVSITTPEGANLILRVAGIFSFGIGSFDETKSYASIATVQKVLQRDPSYITDLHIKLKDYAEARATGKKIASTFNVYTEDWETANASLLAGDKIRNAMTGVISFTLLLVAGFGIYNIMNMNIMNKMKDIAILKATGFGGKDIVAIFLSQSLFIGTIGGLLGVAVGYVCCLALDVTPFPEGDFFRMKTMPVNFNPKFYIAGLWFGIVTTLFAGYFPAKKASNIDPVQIIRG
jgi:lipoprotein-releasing system permease protein